MTEFIVKVGGLFVNTKYLQYTDNIQLVAGYTEAARYRMEDLNKVINYFILHEVPYQVYQIDGKATLINNYIPPTEVKETV